MKQLIILIGAMIVSSYSFAGIPSAPFSKSLSTAWKTEQSLHAKQDKNDIAIVYGGADISRKLTVVTHLAVA